MVRYQISVPAYPVNTATSVRPSTAAAPSAKTAPRPGTGRLRFDCSHSPDLAGVREADTRTGGIARS
jgi:hypothetical protein